MNNLIHVYGINFSNIKKLENIVDVILFTLFDSPKQWGNAYSSLVVMKKMGLL